MNLATVSQTGLEALRKLELEFMKNEVVLPCVQKLYAGMYHRTVKIPKGYAIVGALIAIPTLLIVSGHIRMNSGDEVMELEGYRILHGEANRKQVIYALEDTFLTMVFPTSAKTVEEAEEEFTTETSRLQTRRYS